MKRKHKIEVSYQEIFRKGTVTLVTTFGAGALFGMKNMMIAFSLTIGSWILANQNLKIKTVYKALRLILIDMLIVCIAYLASLNKWTSIPINLIAIFFMIYLNVSLYHQTAYKTLTMLYVFCQYTSIGLEDLPKRLGMILFVVLIIVAVIYREQNKVKTLLSPQIGKTFELINRQLNLMLKEQYDSKIGEQISYQMNELAYEIYRTSFRNYFTTYIGKVNFHFYLNLSYFNILLEQMNMQRERGTFSKEQIRDIETLFKDILVYFDRKIKREELITQFETYLQAHLLEDGIEEEIREAIIALRKNFKRLNIFIKKDTKEDEEGKPLVKKDEVYDGWERSDLGDFKYRVRQYFKPSSMSFNFAARMAIVLTISLFLAQLLGFYKFIWVIIPITSIAQPYYEDTNKRSRERLESNILAAVIITLIIDVIHIKWIVFTVLIVAFYLYYAYKDFYHTSLYLTIISMCVSAVHTGINELLFYRVIYVVLGVVIVVVMNQVAPYKLEDGINELIAEAEELNQILEEESLLNRQGKADLNKIREAIVYSAVLCQKLYLKNKQYKSEKVNYLIQTNTEFVVRLGHRLLSEP